MARQAKIYRAEDNKQELFRILLAYCSLVGCCKLKPALKAPGFKRFETKILSTALQFCFNFYSRPYRLVIETMGKHREWGTDPKSKARCKGYESEVAACLDEMERQGPDCLQVVYPDTLVTSSTLMFATLDITRILSRVNGRLLVFRSVSIDSLGCFVMPC